MHAKTSISFDLSKSKDFIEKANLDERQRRMFYGFLSSQLGYGGSSAVAKCLAVSPITVRKAQQEYLGEVPTEKERIRKPGGGRKKVAVDQPGLKEFVEKLLESATYGNPEQVLLWTTLSLRKIAEKAREAGFHVSHTAISSLLDELGYSKQANAKLLQVGESHPDRDAQFQFIADTAKSFIDQGLPVISIDCKKKENIGNFKNHGTEYRKIKDPRPVKDHDYLDKELGKVSPYGIFVLNDNTGFINLGTDHDTAEFAAQSCFDWWEAIGKENFPKAKKILVTCDGGGSNGSRNRLWKWSLAVIAELTGLEIHVCHFPPGTSKWNKVEHRLFAYISKNWAGKPLIDIQTVVNLISSTTTTKGLKVACQVDNRAYETGIKVTDEQMSEIDIQPVGPFEKWNYVITGMKKHQ